MTSIFKYFVVHALVILCVKNTVAVPQLGSKFGNVFDQELYQNVLDPVECNRQLTYMRNDTLLLARFMDASWRIPRSILRGGTFDFGSYFHCLELSQDVPDESMHIEGKYCAVEVPTNQDFNIPTTIPELPNLNITWPNITLPEINLPEPEVEGFAWSSLNHRNIFTEEYLKKYGEMQMLTRDLGLLFGDSTTDVSRTEVLAPIQAMNVTFKLAFCVPKVCTSREAIEFFRNANQQLNTTSNLTYNELFCRLPNDKPWVTADTVAVVILSFIGILTILSSAYDFRHTVILERDPKRANKLYQSFSMYTNTKNFFVFPSGSSVVYCLDGVRSFAMIWVIVGHTFVTQLTYIPENPLDLLDYITQFTSIWVTSGPITVDTFFLISGLLLVYTTAAKVSRRTLVKSIHLFYLNRILRMFPVLAFGILMLVSFQHKTADGPFFHNMAKFVEDCRNNWWATLLYVQNFVNPSNMCLPHSWYLAIDMQLYVISPVVLFWVLGGKRTQAWLALWTALIAVVAGSTVYNFLNDFQSATVALSRPGQNEIYLFNYYIHTLPRAAPFFIGMIFGYLLNLYRDKRPSIPIPVAILFWILSLGGTFCVVMSTYWNIQPDWDNQLVDNLLNSYMRCVWATSVGWIIFACHNGYGGPANWVLSLYIFKILGRLSYAMYILHYPLIYLINATTLRPIYFGVSFSFHRFFVDFSLAVIAAFLVTIFIDFPITNLIKMAMPGPRKRPPPKEKPSLSVETPVQEVPRSPSIKASNDDEKKTRM